MVLASVKDADLKSRLSTIEDPLVIIDQLQTKYVNSLQMQKDAKRRVRKINPPSNWAEQTAALNLAVNIIELFRDGPGITSLDDQLFELLITHCLTRQQLKDWDKYLREATVQQSTFGSSIPSTSLGGSLYSSAD